MNEENKTLALRQHQHDEWWPDTFESYSVQGKKFNLEKYGNILDTGEKKKEEYFSLRNDKMLMFFFSIFFSVWTTLLSIEKPKSKFKVQFESYVGI